MSSGPAPTLTAVMPVLDGEDQLRQSVPPLVAAMPEPLLELIVVDDGSTDRSADVARELGARVVVSGGRGLGPALARNVGSAQANGDVLVFVDADVVASTAALERVQAAFRDPEVGAVYGSYDASPADRGLASLYMNLRHHHGHRGHADDVRTFWAGFGAIRRDAFAAVGGYDAAAFPYPSVEDIDLGRRLREAGFRIRRDPDIQGKHLKRWTWRSVVHTDIARRAIPWTKLMLAHPGAYTDLNVSGMERVKALLAAALIAVTVLAIAGLLPLWSVPVVLVAAVLANLELAKLFWRGGGAVCALVCTLFHQLHLVYSGMTYVWCRLRHS